MDPLIGYLLIASGAVCMLAELAMFTGGILAGIGTILAIVGVGFNLLFVSVEAGMISAVVLCVGLPIIGTWLFRIWPSMSMNRKLIEISQVENSIATIPANEELFALVGQVGTVIAALRPSGIVEFSGKRVDVITQGMMIDVGETVRCFAVRSGRVWVGKIERTIPTKNERKFSDLSQTDIV